MITSRIVIFASSHLRLSVTIPPHVAALVDDLADHQTEGLVLVHLPGEHQPRLLPSLLLLPHTLLHVPPNQLQQLLSTFDVGLPFKVRL